MSVTVIGDAFIDLIVPLYGIRRGETYHRKILMSCGGTANVAIQIAKLGERAKFIGKVGDDIFGKYFRQNLRRNGVKDLTFVDKENPTGICVSLVYKDGERTMIAHRGANDFLTREEIGTHIDNIVSSKIVYISGYSLLSPTNREAVLYVLEKCHGNCKIYFNPGAPNLVRKEFVDVIQNFVDVLIVNEEEVKAITGKNEVNEAIKMLSGMVDFVVVTLGKKGCIVSGKEGYSYVKGRQINAFDTTGAGDAFAAGFIVGNMRNMDKISCARLGNKVAVTFLMEKGKKLTNSS